MAKTSRTFRIFVSSTFSDLKEERNALQKHVFPKLRELCVQHGCRFQAIDLRWGVSEEASLDQQTVKMCLEEIARCQKTTPRPNFIVLLGDRYGWRPLPHEIPANEFEQILNNISDEGDRVLLNSWYWRDDNAVPTIYDLQPRTGKFIDYNKWEAVENKIRSIFLQAIDKIPPLAKEGRGDLSDDVRLKYTASATEQEIVHGALSVPDAKEHIFCFFRKIKNLDDLYDLNPPLEKGGEGGFSKAKDFIDLNEKGNPDIEARTQLDNLKTHLHSLLPENVYDYDTEWKGNGITTDHITKLCDDVYNSLSNVILEEITKLEEVDPLEKEIADHDAFGKERAKFFIGRTSILQSIADYIKGNDNHPLTIYGESGSGKTALMAKAIADCELQNSECVVVSRFIGATPASSDGRSLLESLCKQIYRAFDFETQKQQKLVEIKGRDESSQKMRQDIEKEFAIPSDFQKLSMTFRDFLPKIPTDGKLVVFLDALDQLSNIDYARNLVWLPSELPKNVRFIVSTLPGECLSVFERRLSSRNHSDGRSPEESPSIVKLETMPQKEGAELLDLWLSDAHRTLQEEQRADILFKFEKCGLPLYLKLAFEEARRWKSYDGLPKGADETHGLSANIPGIIRDLFWRLSQDSNHGSMMVLRSMGYLAAAKNGLSEDEILDVLSLDSDVFNDFKKRAKHEPPEERLPVIVWSRLYFDLEPYLTERTADGTSLMTFYHRQLGEVVIEGFLAEEEKKKRHEGLAGYFGSQPLWIEKDKKKSPNIRKVSELPYQQAFSSMGDELCDTLLNFHFMESKLSAFGIQELIKDYDLAFIPSLVASTRKIKESEKSLRLVQGALRLSAYVLTYDRNKTQLPGHLLGRLLSCKEPEIQVLLEQAKQQHGKCWLQPLNCCLALPGGALLHTYKAYVDIYSHFNVIAVTPNGRKVISGASDVAWNHILRVWDLETGTGLLTMKGHKDDVNSVAVTPDGRKVVSASRDDTLKVWDLETGAEIFTMKGHKDDVNSVAVTPDGRKVVSTSWDDTLKVWDLETGVEILTIKGNKSLFNPIAVTPNGSKAISVSHILHTLNHTLKVWDLETGAEILTMKGHKDIVSSIVVTPDGRKVISGAWDNTLKVWDLETGAELLTLEGHDHHVNSVAVTPDGQRVISGSSTTLKIWALDKTGSKPYNLKCHTSPILSVAITPDGKKAVSGSEDGIVKVWDVKTMAELFTFNHIGSITSVAITPDGKKAVSGSEDGIVKVWDVERGKEIQSLDIHTDGIKVLVAASVDYTPTANTEDSVLQQMILPGFTTVVKTPSVIALDDDTLWLLQFESRIFFPTLGGYQSPGKTLIVTPNGREAVSVADNSSFDIWDLETGMMLPTIKRSSPALFLSVVPKDMQYYVSISGRENVFVAWQLKNKKTIAWFEVENPINAIAATQDGKTMIAGDSLGQIYFLRLEGAE